MATIEAALIADAEDQVLAPVETKKDRLLEPVIESFGVERKDYYRQAHEALGQLSILGLVAPAWLLKRWYYLT